MSGLLARLWPKPRPGEAGETLACERLAQEGLTVLARNFRCRSGELDVVARDKDGTVVFVEVKERHGRSHGEGHEAVTFGKRRRLVRAARIYASHHGLTESAIRFDVMSVDWEGRTPSIRHDRGAFDADGF
jgi:putative endonuclease